MYYFYTYIVVPLHRWLYEVSNGRIGNQLAGIPCLLLYVTGRKSGKEYTIPLAYHPEGNEYIVVASNHGLPRHPGWYFNVMADDNATARVGDAVMPIQARELEGEERETVWQHAIQTNPAWDGYRTKTDRLIPLIALRPIE